MAGKKSLFSLDPQLEGQFRAHVKRLNGRKKGVLSAAMNEAMSLWLERYGNVAVSSVPPTLSQPSYVVTKKEGALFQAVFLRLRDAFGVFKVIHTLVDEATFGITPLGIMYRGMDPSHIAMIDGFISAKDLLLLHCKEPDLKFGVRVDKIAKAEDLFSKHQQGEIFIENGSALVIQDVLCAKLRSQLIKSAATDTPLPKLQFNANASLKTPFLRGELQKAKKVGEYVRLECSQDGGMKISATGDSEDYECPVPTAELLDFACKESSKAIYALDYLDPLFKAVAPGNAPPYFPSCQLNFSSKMPLKIRFPFGQCSWIDYFLAPRVKD